MRTKALRSHQSPTFVKGFEPGKLYYHKPTGAVVLAMGLFETTVDFPHGVVKANRAPLGIQLAPKFSNNWRLVEPRNYEVYNGSMVLS